MSYKIKFDDLEWSHPFVGVKDKSYVQDGKKLRLVEYSKEMPPHWCEKGHYGIILEGTFEIEYGNETLTYHKGDGVFIPNGAEHKHRARVIGEKVTALLVEENSERNHE